METYIEFIATGGTIDKNYPTKSKTRDLEIGTPAIERIISRFTNISFDYSINSLFKLDSLDITHESRVLILKSCLKSKSDKIIITHGTDTMPETARMLNEIKNKTIILTGAMIPERFVDTDAYLNVGMAIGAVQTLSHGIHICMNGRIFDGQNVMKDPETATFREIY
jgi:L-asparaginase